MLSKSTWSSLSSAERQLIRRQYQQSGKCVRCFHASLRRHAGDGGSASRNNGPANGNDSGTSYNQPQRGPSRHQRAAQISEEVRLLNRDVPNLGPSKPPSDGLAEPANNLAGPGNSFALGVMGENEPPSREGPLAQGVGRGLLSPREDEGIGADNQAIGGVRTPENGVEEPQRGGAAVLGGAQEERLDKAAETQASADPTKATKKRQRKVLHAGPSFIAEEITYENLVEAGNNSATIVSNNFPGVIADRLRTVAEPGGTRDPSRDIQSLAHKLISKQIVRFNSREEKDAVMQAVRQIIAPGSDPTAQQKAALGDTVGDRINHYYWRPLRTSIRTELKDKMVKGSYDSSGLFHGETPHNQPVLNQIARLTAMNGTYATKDSERFLQKVKALLPAAAPAKAQVKAPPAKAA